MNLTSGFNSNLEKKTVSEQNIEREIAHDIEVTTIIDDFGAVKSRK